MKRYVESERKVYSSVDLADHTLNTQKPVDSIFYYTIRCNAVHRGKAYFSGEDMLRQSLRELLNIFKEVLEDTFK